MFERMYSIAEMSLHSAEEVMKHVLFYRRSSFLLSFKNVLVILLSRLLVNSEQKSYLYASRQMLLNANTASIEATQLLWQKKQL